METSKYREVLEKIQGVNTLDEVKSILSAEEIVCYLLNSPFQDESLEEGDECLIKDILLLLKASRRSTRHSLFVLEETEKVLLQLSGLRL